MGEWASDSHEFHLAICFPLAYWSCAVLLWQALFLGASDQQALLGMQAAGLKRRSPALVSWLLPTW